MKKEILVKSREIPEGWQSPGVVKKKPTNCSFCRFQTIGQGFCPPFAGKTPRIGMIFPSPDSEEVVNRCALDSSRGRRFLHTYVEPFGLTKEDLVIRYCVSCCPPWDNRKKERSYPPASIRRNAEAVCDRYSNLQQKGSNMVPGGIVKFDPDIFVFSFDPADTIKTPALHRIIFRCIERALHLENLGYKPCLLFGTESVLMHFPWIDGHGGLKAFVGHYVEGRWKSQPPPSNKKGFTIL